MMNHTQKNQIALIVKDTVSNYLTLNDKPEEKEFREWLSERQHYYCNRITNTICSAPVFERVTNVDVIKKVADEIDKLRKDQEDASKGIDRETKTV